VTVTQAVTEVAGPVTVSDHFRKCQFNLNFKLRLRTVRASAVVTVVRPAPVGHAGEAAQRLPFLDPAVPAASAVTIMMTPARVVLPEFGQPAGTVTVGRVRQSLDSLCAPMLVRRVAC
jgi:hypothetical protein